MYSGTFANCNPNIVNNNRKKIVIDDKKKLLAMIKSLAVVLCIPYNVITLLLYMT